MEELRLGALAHHREGRLAEAEDRYRRILERNPKHAESIHYLGLVCYQLKKYDEAAAMMRNALALEPGVAFFHSNYGLVLHSMGDFAGAIAAYESALRLDSKAAETTSNLGITCLVMGKLEDAAAAFERAILLRPDFPEAVGYLSLVRSRQGRLDESVMLSKRAIVLDPGNALAWTRLGDVLQQQESFDLAATCYERAVCLQPEVFELHNSLGNLLQRQGRLEEAAASYQKALALAPDSPDVCGNLGSALQGRKQLTEAISLYERAIKLEPGRAAFHYNCGTAYRDQGKNREAEECLRRATVLEPAHALAWNNLGNLLRDNDRFDEAVACYRKVLAVEPKSWLAHYNLGCCQRDQALLPAAIKSFECALIEAPKNPQVQFSIGLLQLAQGNFASGWRAYDLRWESQDHDTPKRSYSQQLWNGEQIQGGRLLLWGEQGIGDEMMFAGLIPELVRGGVRCVVDCHPRLQTLFARSFPECAVVTGCGVPEASRLDIRAQAPTGGLAKLLRPSEAAFKRGGGAYLIADPTARARFRQRYDDGRLVVGLSWFTRGKKTGRARSIELSVLEPLFRVAGIRWVSLQYGDYDELQIAVDAAGAPLELDRSVDQMRDTDEFASQVSAMDLVVTIDNATAHLAGALGIPVWVMLPSPADWRWMEGRSDSLWYRSMTLFRQQQRGEWGSVLEEVSAALSKRVG